MGADTKKLRNRIKSVDSTLHLTKAMGLVASSKIRRATEAMNKSRQYAEAFGSTIKALVACSECAKSPYMAQRGENRTRLIVIAGDRGLAGGYNANVFRTLRSCSDADVIAVGKRACDRFGGGYLSAEKFSCEEAMEISKKLCADFVNNEFDRLGILYTKYVSVLSQEAQIKWVLPLQREATVRENSVLFEPDELSILELAVTEYVAGMIVAAVRESFASEVAARRSAMDSAEKNAQQMIDELQLDYNRARQGAITQELTEIVAGYGT